MSVARVGVRMRRGIIATWIFSVAFAAIGSASAFSQDYPTKQPIHLVVGFPPGGPTDIVGRVIADGLAKELKQTVLIENRGGAGGIIGAAIVAKAKPDGYTLLVSVESSQTRGLALNPTLGYDQLKDFTFIRKLAKQRNLVLVHPSVPIHSLAELIAYDKAHPGELNCSGTFGTSSHIGCALFNTLADTKLTFVNYPGGSAPISDLIAGTVQVGFFTEATVAQQVTTGKLRPLAIATSERSPAFPDIPTVEQAVGKPLDISPWFGVVGPADLPADVAKTLGDALDKVTASPEFLTQLETIGAVPIRGSTAESFQKDVAREIVFWNKWAEEIKTPLAR
jgi:tripartite-type tricarboxylate transporter receptor subunit TctC